MKTLALATALFLASQLARSPEMTAYSRVALCHALWEASATADACVPHVLYEME